MKKIFSVLCLLLSLMTMSQTAQKGLVKTFLYQKEENDFVSYVEHASDVRMKGQSFEILIQKKNNDKMIVSDKGILGPVKEYDSYGFPSNQQKYKTEKGWYIKNISNNITEGPFEYIEFVWSLIPNVQNEPWKAFGYVYAKNNQQFIRVFGQPTLGPFLSLGVCYHANNQLIFCYSTKDGKNYVNYNGKILGPYDWTGNFQYYDNKLFFSYRKSGKSSAYGLPNLKASFESVKVTANKRDSVSYRYSENKKQYLVYKGKTYGPSKTYISLLRINNNYEIDMGSEIVYTDTNNVFHGNYILLDGTIFKSDKKIRLAHILKKNNKTTYFYYNEVANCTNKLRNKGLGYNYVTGETTTNKLATNEKLSGYVDRTKKHYLYSVIPVDGVTIDQDCYQSKKADIAETLIFDGSPVGTFEGIKNYSLGENQYLLVLSSGELILNGKNIVLENVGDAAFIEHTNNWYARVESDSISKVYLNGKLLFQFETKTFLNKGIGAGQTPYFSYFENGKSFFVTNEKRFELEGINNNPYPLFSSDGKNLAIVSPKGVYINNELIPCAPIKIQYDKEKNEFYWLGIENNAFYSYKFKLAEN